MTSCLRSAMEVEMVTDDERREVARRLRRAWTNVPDKNPVRHHMRVLYEIYAAVGLNDDGVDAIDLFDRLADLIDPDCREGARPPRPVDREALLALAEEIEDNDVTYCVSTQYVLDSYASRIREALGVDDG